VRPLPDIDSIHMAVERYNRSGGAQPGQNITQPVNLNLIGAATAELTFEKTRDLTFPPG